MHGGDLSFELWSGLLAKAGDAPALTSQQTAIAWGVMVSFIILLVLIGLGIFALHIYSCVWVFSDAERRGKSGALISLIVFFVWPLGLLIWLVARPEYHFPPMPPLPPDPNAGLGPGEWIGYSLGFLIIPLANVVVSSILYYVWRGQFPRKARQINGLGWTILALDVLMFAIPAFLAYVNQTP